MCDCIRICQNWHFEMSLQTNRCIHLKHLIQWHHFGFLVYCSAQHQPNCPMSRKCFLVYLSKDKEGEAEKDKNTKTRTQCNEHLSCWLNADVVVTHLTNGQTNCSITFFTSFLSWFYLLCNFHKSLLRLAAFRFRFLGVCLHETLFHQQVQQGGPNVKWPEHKSHQSCGNLQFFPPFGGKLSSFKYAILKTYGESTLVTNIAKSFATMPGN